jgi:2-polyprenyl-3-methyl-5-hydroxy-6-metoxy-1,4-benzoquinol methylase
VNCALECTRLDLIELTDGARHPWEKSRAAFFTSVVSRALAGRTRAAVLDCGAGDAFFSANLATAIEARSVTCWDASYDDESVARLDARYRGGASSFDLSFTRSMPERRFDVVLLLDVIEHVEDDVAFVRSIVDTCVEETGLVLVSVPAWQFLFTRHDELLRHHRRYAPAACDRVLEAAGLRIVERGGLFHSLIVPRMASVVRERAERAIGRGQPLGESAAATWSGGALVTSLVDAALRGDNALSRFAARAGLRLPGLSYWALAQKRA